MFKKSYSKVAGVVVVLGIAVLAVLSNQIGLFKGYTLGIVSIGDEITVQEFNARLARGFEVWGEAETGAFALDTELTVKKEASEYVGETDIDLDLVLDGTYEVVDREENNYNSELVFDFKLEDKIEAEEVVVKGDFISINNVVYALLREMTGLEENADVADVPINELGQWFYYEAPQSSVQNFEIAEFYTDYDDILNEEQQAEINEYYDQVNEFINIEVVDSELVNGVMSDKYNLVLNSEKLLEELDVPDEDTNDLELLAFNLATEFITGTELEFDVWFAQDEHYVTKIKSRIAQGNDVELDFELILSEFNEPVEIKAPEDAEEISRDDSYVFGQILGQEDPPYIEEIIKVDNDIVEVIFSEDVEFDGELIDNFSIYDASFDTGLRSMDSGERVSAETLQILEVREHETDANKYLIKTEEQERIEYDLDFRYDGIWISEGGVFLGGLPEVESNECKVIIQDLPVFDFEESMLIKIPCNKESNRTVINLYDANTDVAKKTLYSCLNRTQCGSRQAFTWDGKVGGTPVLDGKYYLKGSFEIDGQKHPTKKTKTFITDFSLFKPITPRVSKTEFPDVAPINTPYYKEIYWMADNGYISGYPDGTFRPNNCVNRAELTKMVSEVTGQLQPTGQLFRIFPDVKQSDWFYNYVTNAESRGWVQGYPDGLFRPAQCVNRVEAVKIAMEAFDIQTYLYEGDHPYIDIRADEWYYIYLMPALNMDLLGTRHVQNVNTGGIATLKFFPKGDMSRAEVAEMLFRMTGVSTVSANNQNSEVEASLSDAQIRNNQRRLDATRLANAISAYNRDHPGEFLFNENSNLPIAHAGGDSNNFARICDQLVPDYLSELPADESLDFAYFSSCDSYHLGYSVRRNTDGTFTVTASGAELGEYIGVTR